MNRSFRYCESEQQKAAVAFGQLLRRWRERCGWTQYTIHQWAGQAGFAALAPSTMSVLENGKAPKPRPETFFALGEANRRIDVGDFTGVTDRALLQLLQQGKPLCGAGDDDTIVWGPAEFWSCHVGLLPVPADYAMSEPVDLMVSDEQAEELSDRLTAAFRLAVERVECGPIEGLRAVGRAVPAKHRHRFQHIACGLGGFTPAEIKQLGGESVVREWIEKAEEELNRYG